MKLIEKFEEVEYGDFDGLVKIVDEFAIGFAEWIGVDDGKQLLEIYKKEKEL